MMVMEMVGMIVGVRVYYSEGGAVTQWGCVLPLTTSKKQEPGAGHQ
jgi:hypothetical protein